VSTHELADFEPSDGHLHECLNRGELSPLCDCAALLYCVAQDLSIEVTQLRREVRLRERQ
jgi:hypothetical protein